MSNNSFIFYYQTVIGTLGIAEADGKLTHVNICSRKWPADCIEQETPLLAEAAHQIKEYLAGQRKEFNLPLAPQGTPFQLKVWAALQTIPYGETATYKDIAVKVGSPLGCRAVGMANNKNPIGIVIPCHRVVGSNGKLVGYAGGLDIKAKLLNLEQINK